MIADKDVWWKLSDNFAVRLPLKGDKVPLRCSLHKALENPPEPPW